MKIKREKSVHPIGQDESVLKDILDGAILRENYELAAIIKEALDQINSKNSTDENFDRSKTTGD